ncbi:hypothetical protein PG990_011428 [Apiospora arundinis]
MASIRSPSPAGGDAATSGSPILSPRSKLQKELAALDESSDEEITGPIDTKALFKKLDEAKLQHAQKPTVESATTTTTTDAAEEAIEENDDEDDEDEEEIIQPRGRVAARMLAGAAKKSGVARQIRITSKDDTEQTEHFSATRSPTPEDASTRHRSVSPGLFVSPSPSPQKKTKNTTTAGSDSEDDLPTDLTKSSRFQALVARKRQERLQKEAEEQKKRDERAKRMAEQMPAGAEDTEEDDVSDITDDEGGHKLTQLSSSARRPARQASKRPSRR